MLEGAMRELAVGDPRRLATDVGPVIDAEARAALAAHVAADARSWATASSQLPLPHGCASGTFVAADDRRLATSTASAQLKREVFGPVLHVVR